MADQSVQITGLGPKLPKWATDATLREIEVEVKKLVEILQKKQKIKDVSVKKAQESLDDFESSLQKLNEEQDETQKSIKKLRASFGDASQDTADALEKVRSAGHGGFTSMTNLTYAGQGLFTIFKNLASPATVLGGTFVLAGEAISTFIDYIKETTQTMIGLYDTGLTFQNGLGDLRIATATAAMPLEDFAKLLTESSAVVKTFGDNGALTFASILRDTRSLIREQGYYALNIGQVNKYTADYLEILRSQGLLTRMTDQQRSESSAEYIKQLTSFSQIMGKSREEINRQIQETMKNPELLAITGSLGPLGKEFTKTMTSIIGGLSGVGGEQSGKVIGDVVTMIGTLNGPLTDLYQGLLAAGRGDLAKQILDLSTDIRNNAIPLDVAQERLKAFLQGVQHLSQKDIQNLRESTQVQGSALHDQAELIISMNSNLQGLDLNKITEKMVQEPDKFTKAVVKLSNLFTEIRGRFALVFADFIEANQSSFDRIITNISDFADYLAKKLQVVLDTLANLIDPKTRAKAISDIEKGLRTVLDALFQAVSDLISVKLYHVSHGLLGSSPEYIQAREKYGTAIADYVTNKGAQDRFARRKKGGLLNDWLFGPDYYDVQLHDAFIKSAKARGLNPEMLLHPGPGPAPLADHIMNNAPATAGLSSGSGDLQGLTDKQNELFFKPVLDALGKNNDLTAKVVDLSDSANGHLVSIKRAAGSNPNIVKFP